MLIFYPLHLAARWSEASAAGPRPGPSAFGFCPVGKDGRHTAPVRRSSNLATACLTALDVHTECLRGDLERIPARGPVVLFANHPSGALEGLMLAALCGKARPDLKILASDALLRIPQLAQLAPMLLPLNLSGGAAANAACCALP